jgi:predicted Holliday junction resolvase-like endonuclease
MLEPCLLLILILAIGIVVMWVEISSLRNRIEALESKLKTIKKGAKNVRNRKVSK